MFRTLLLLLLLLPVTTIKIRVMRRSAINRTCNFFFYYSSVILWSPSDARESFACAKFDMIGLPANDCRYLKFFFHLVGRNAFGRFIGFSFAGSFHRHAFVGRHDRSPSLPVRPASAADVIARPEASTPTSSRDTQHTRLQLQSRG